MIVHWLFCIQDGYPLIQSDYRLGAGCFAKNTFHVQGVFGACLELVWRFEQISFYIASLRAKLRSMH